MDAKALDRRKEMLNTSRSFRTRAGTSVRRACISVTCCCPTRQQTEGARGKARAFTAGSTGGKLSWGGSDPSPVRMETIKLCEGFKCVLDADFQDIKHRKGLSMHAEALNTNKGVQVSKPRRRIWNTRRN